MRTKVIITQGVLWDYVSAVQAPKSICLRIDYGRDLKEMPPTHPKRLPVDTANSSAMLLPRNRNLFFFRPQKPTI